MAQRFISPFEGYEDILHTIRIAGELTTSRAGDTYEIEDYSCLFEDSSAAVQPKRPGFSPLLGFMEGVQLVGSFSRPALMDAMWPKYSTYTDHYGDYGDRINYGSQLQYVIDTLKKDPDSRRAILVMWNGTMDTEPGHLDHPCTLSISFRIRKDRLNMSVSMRSNDIWRGASSDFIQFSLLHQTVAALLGVEPGTYHHSAQSMHLYLSDIDAAGTWKIRAESLQKYDTLSTVRPIFKYGWSYDDVRLECQQILSAATRPDAVATDMGREIATARFHRQKKLLDDQ